MITIQLNKQLERTLENLAGEQGLTKSELVQKCVEDFVARKQNGDSPWNIGKELFGKYGSGRGNLSVDRKKIVKEKIHAKRNSD